MKTFTKILIIISLLTYSKIYAQNLSGSMLFTAHLDGKQNNVNTKAGGVATILLSPKMDSAKITISWNGLSGAVTGIHIHKAKPGQTGAVVNDLSMMVMNNQVSGLITGAGLTKNWIKDLFNGDYYINIHTAMNPNGEIRGQLMLNTDWSFPVSLDMTQAGLSGNAKGLAVFNLSADKKKMWYMMISENLSDTITAAHLHKGGMGQSGLVLVDLHDGIYGKHIWGWVDVDSAAVAALMMNQVYLNIHTTANAGGEIRGQLTPPMHIMGYSWMDAQQNGLSNTAKGVATLEINSNMDSLWYTIMTSGLSGSITGIHFHYGAKGQTGGVAADLTGSVSGNMIKGVITGSNLSAALLSAWTKNELYINVHTSANPNGEIRGQLMRLAREGFVSIMDGKQNGLTGITAMGSGYVSIDAMGTNAECLFVMDGMSEAPTGIHFHKGPMGSNGGLLLDLDGWFTANNKGGTVWGYWEKDTGTNPFTWNEMSLFWHDSVYINAHTTANPNGEIRGQIMRNPFMNMVNNSIDENIGSDIQLYPNPVENIFYIQNKNLNQTTPVYIYDLNGKLIYTQTITGNENYINIETLPVGCYVLEITTTNQKIRSKLIKH